MRTALVLRDLTVTFGGLVAVNKVSLEAPLGQITGLIGPNGAGKSTTFNACTGLLRPTVGTVELLGRDVTNAPPSARAQIGLVRTFQRLNLYNSLSVRENVRLGLEALLAGASVWRQLRTGASERRRMDEVTNRELERCGIAHLSSARPAELSTGQRRLVELARALANPGQCLLLDEPSSGLDPDETEQFGSILRDVVADRGIGIVLVEHDMALVRAVCDHAYVLDFGSLILDGPIDQVLDSPEVRAAYLGSEAA